MVGLALVFILPLQPFIAPSHLVVSNQGRDVIVHQLRHIGIAVATRIGCHQGVQLPTLSGLLDHGQQHRLL